MPGPVSGTPEKSKAPTTSSVTGKKLDDMTESEQVTDQILEMGLIDLQKRTEKMIEETRQSNKESSEA